MSWLTILFPLLFGIVFATILFVNNITAHRLHHFSTTHWLDAYIPFVPAFALPYFSAYLLAIVPYLVLHNDPRFAYIMLGYVVIYGVSNISYLLLPTRVERRETLTAHTLSTYALQRFQGVSKPFNNFPSMHVSYCLFSALIVLTYTDARWAWGGLVWAVVVALSTLFTKQHHLVDVGAGALLATLAYTVVRMAAT